jgi:hypothetical protein
MWKKQFLVNFKVSKEILERLRISLDRPPPCDYSIKNPGASGIWSSRAEYLYQLMVHLVFKKTRAEYLYQFMVHLVFKKTRAE